MSCLRGDLTFGTSPSQRWSRLVLRTYQVGSDHFYERKQCGSPVCLSHPSSVCSCFCCRDNSLSRRLIRFARRDESGRLAAHGVHMLAGEPAANPGVMLINVAGGGTWFPRMLEWADMQWQWRNPYTGACFAMIRLPRCASYRRACCSTMDIDER